MNDKLSTLKTIFTNFLAKYHIPLPLFALGVFFIIALPLVLFLLTAGLSSPQTTGEFPTPTVSTNQQDTSNSTPLPTITSGEPTPTTNPDLYYQDDPEYIESVDEISKEEQAALSRDMAVSNFMDSLPYQGTHIRVTYSIADNTVRVVMKNATITQANKEFDDLLKKYSVQSRDWIPDLQITFE